MLDLSQLWRLNAQMMRYPGVVLPEEKGAMRDTQLEAALKLFPAPKDGK